MINKILVASSAIFLLVCSIFIGQVIYDRYFENKQDIVLVQSDLFKDVSYINLEEIIKDDAVRPLFVREDKLDIGFKTALFYSDLSIVILKRSKEQKSLKKYVKDLYNKSQEKWDELILKDNSMLFFKNYYLKVYKDVLDSKTN